MANMQLNDFINKIKIIYDFSSPYIDPKKELLNNELCIEIEKNPQIVSHFINELLSLDLSEEKINNLYFFSRFLVDNNRLKNIISEKEFNFYLAIQYLFAPYLHFQIPLALWFSLATESWKILKEYNSLKFSTIDDFANNIQSHIEKCSDLLESFREHPAYGEKIKAKDWGYV